MARRRRAASIGLGLVAEALESRVLLSADVRSIDGSGNNLVHTDWGSAGTDLLRFAPAAYADGISTPAGDDRPSARVVSNTIAAQGDEDLPNDRFTSDMLYVWGQFLDHDIDLTVGANPSVPFNIPVPAGDPEFDPEGTGSMVINLNRSAFDETTGTSTSNPRQQINSITAFIDASQVYGSDAELADSLRTHVGGRLLTSEGNLLPFADDGGAGDGAPRFFLAGDIRANENVQLTSMHVLFVREHNRLADQIHADHPELTDEQIYQRARAIVGAEIQAITYHEFLPALIGEGVLRPYQGYNPAVNPGIANEFSTAIFRVGHTTLDGDIERLDNEGRELEGQKGNVALRDAFFNPLLLNVNPDEAANPTGTDIDPVLKGVVSGNSQEIDNKLVDDVRNFLFGPPGSGGLDLASLNVQRGRDHGLADYNTVREAYGLPRVTSFAQITSNPEVQQQLEELYGTVDNIDLWVGALAEDHVRGASVGPLVQRVIADQFMRLRDGDRFWYQNAFSGRQLEALEHTRLSDIIRRNTGVNNIQDDVFYFRTAIAGRVFADGNGDGRSQSVERGIGGRTIQLLDEEGVVIRTTLTDRDGSYRFTGLELGSYTVQELLPAGITQTTSPTIAVELTRGMAVNRQDFGEVPLSLPPRRMPPGPLPGGPLPGGPGRPGMPPPPSDMGEMLPPQLIDAAFGPNPRRNA